MIVTFLVSIEIDEAPVDGTDVMEFKDEMHRILAEFEEIVAKKGYALDDSDWETDN